MRQFRVILYRVLILLILPGYSFSQIQQQLKWEYLPPVPYVKYVSGAYAGVVNDKLYVMGGVDAEGKVYRYIYVLEGHKEWKLSEQKLPDKFIIEHAVSYRNSTILIGVNNNITGVSKVYRLYEMNGKIVIDGLPPLL